jgi:PAS domain S-box-containing protein
LAVANHGKSAAMTALNRARADTAPALHRLLSERALSRAALGACGFPLAIVDATAPARTVTFVNAAFEGFFGYRPGEALGRPLAALLFRGDDALLHRLLAESASRWQVKAWAKDGTLRHVELALGAVRGAEGRLTHWVAAFSDRAEVERLRAELAALRR